MKISIWQILCILAVVIVVGCIDKVSEDKAFTLLNAKQTGLNFNNRLLENTYMNGFFYQYYYNGAGLATADFNHDGLIDIYFISSIRENRLFLNQGELIFKDVTAKSGVKGKPGFPTGVTVVDINDDGLMDIYISKSGRIKVDDQLRNELYVNLGNGEDGVPVFEERAHEYALDVPHYSTQASFFDYDRDGDLDMFLINHGLDVPADTAIAGLLEQNSEHAGEKLYENENGKFVDVTHEAGIISNPLGFTLGVSVGDVNNDGWPDIYTANDYSEKDHLYLNNQDGTFRETSLKAFGHIPNFSMGTDMADINNDGFLDIMSLDMMASDNYTQKTSMSGMDTQRFFDHVRLGLHNQYMYNALQLNNGINENGVPMFSDIAQLANVATTDWSWSPLIFDMNNDGHKDLFVSNGVKRDFRNNDFNTYKKQKQLEALSKGVLDKEAYMKDMLDKMPERKKENFFFVNNKDLTFKQLSFKQLPSNSNGAAFADFDNDGDLDVVVNNSEDQVFLYRNDFGGDFLDVQLSGPDGNKNGLGTRLEIYIDGQKQIQEHHFTRGFQSASAGPVHFGLGAIEKIDSLIVLWPEGKRQRVLNPIKNQKLVVRYDLDNSIPYNDVVSDSKQFEFRDITATLGINFRHKEDEFDDFAQEILIPHKMSTQGPSIEVGDVNGDGLEDFFIGGAKNQKSRIYLQYEDGKFYAQRNLAIEKDSIYEDTGAHFFDADKDGDLDLYLASGGNDKALTSDHYHHRFYANDGYGNFTSKKNVLPVITISGKAIASGDIDGDGDLDLFVGSRVKPGGYGQYSKSWVLENQSEQGSLSFLDITETDFPFLLEYPMVTDAEWSDLDRDGKLDLIVSNEWGAIEVYLNKENRFENVTEKYQLSNYLGWWNSIEVEDVDGDGYLDIIAGNLGLNYKYKSSQEKPFRLYVNDFDENQDPDIVLGYQERDQLYPLRGRECSSNQMPFIKKKFKTYDAFGKATLEDVYGEKLNEGIQYTATEFRSGIFLNKKEYFEFIPFSNEVQVSSINAILVLDINKDKHYDLLAFGNLYESEVETPRNDAGYGHMLLGNGDGSFDVLSSSLSGLMVKGNVKDAAFLKVENKSVVLTGRNDDALKALEIKRVKHQ